MYMQQVYRYHGNLQNLNQRRKRPHAPRKSMRNEYGEYEMLNASFYATDWDTIVDSAKDIDELV